MDIVREGGRGRKGEYRGRIRGRESKKEGELWEGGQRSWLVRERGRE